MGLEIRIDEMKKGNYVCLEVRRENAFSSEHIGLVFVEEVRGKLWINYVGSEEIKVGDSLMEKVERKRL